MKRRFFPALTLLLITTGFLAAQDDLREVSWFSVEDGLTQSTVNTVFQDSFGLLWIGTGDGLNCYDGTEITHYSGLIGHGFSFTNTAIRRLMEDNEHNLWIGTDKGLYKLNRVNGHIEKPFPGIPLLDDRPCIPAFVTSESVMVLVPGSGLLNVERNSRRHFEHPFPDYWSSLNIISCGKEQVWVTLNQPGLLQVTLDTDGRPELTRYMLPLPPREQVTDLARRDDSTYYLTTPTSLFLYNPLRNSLHRLYPAAEDPDPAITYLNEILIDQEKNVWLSSLDKGLFRLDAGLDIIKSYNSDIDLFGRHFSFHNIVDLYMDRSGNIWFGTDGSGIGKLSTSAVKFGLLNRSANQKLSSDFIRCFYEDSSRNLWIGTFNRGLNRWDRSSGLITHVPVGSDNTYPSANDIYCLAPHTDNSFFAGTFRGIYLVRDDCGTIKLLNTPETENTILRTTQIERWPGHGHMALINRRICILEETGGDWSCRYLPLTDSIGVDRMLLINDKTIWFSGEQGIYITDGRRIVLQPFTWDNNVFKAKVNCLLKAADGRIWGGTNMGLFLFNIDGRIQRIFSQKDGLPNHFLYGLLEDSHGKIWISSNRGLSRFCPDSYAVLNFGIVDGLQSYEFNSNAYFKNSRGEMFFGGINGFNYFHPDSVGYNPNLPEVVLRSIKIFNREFAVDTSLLMKQSLVLRHHQNSITFGFSATEYTNPSKNRFAYRLAGLEKDWIFAGSGREARYTGLPPGKYIFEVKAANNDGVWNEKPASLYITILKPYWMQTWFYIVLGLFIVLLIAAVVYVVSTYRYRRQLAVLERQKEIGRIRRRISSDLHDDIGAGLSKMAFLSDSAQLEAQAHPNLASRFGKLSERAREMINTLNMIVWALNPQYDDLQSLLAYIKRKTGEFADDATARLEVDVPDDVPYISTTPEFRRNVFYIVNEAVHNAIRHSGSEVISVCIAICNHALKVEISDHGNGFDVASPGGHSNGLLNMKRRADELGGKLEIESKSETGTKISVMLPLQHHTKM